MYFLKNVVSGSLAPRCGTSPANKEINRGTRLSLVWLKPDCTIKFWRLHYILIIFGPLRCGFGQNETINEAEIDCRTLFFLSLCSRRNPCASEFWGSNHHSHVTARHSDVTATEFEFNPPRLLNQSSRLCQLASHSASPPKQKPLASFEGYQFTPKRQILFLAPARVTCRGVFSLRILLAYERRHIFGCRLRSQASTLLAHALT